MIKRPVAERVRDAFQPNDEAVGGAAVAAVPFPAENLPGNVQPGGAIGRQIRVSCFKKGQKLALVLAQHVGEFRRAVFAVNEQTISVWFEC